MSKKSSNFALEMKKTYYIPTIEIVTLNTERLMGFGDPSNKGHAPKRRTTEVF